MKLNFKKTILYFTAVLASRGAFRDVTYIRYCEKIGKLATALGELLCN